MVRRAHGTIDKRTRTNGSSAYRAMLRVPGGRLTETFDTEDDAERWILETRLALRAGTWTEPSRLTVAECVDAYIERGASRWQGATEATYHQRHEKHIAPALGSLRVSELGAPQVQAWVDRLVRAKHSPSLIHSCVHVLGGAMKEAVRLGIIQTNPVTGVSLPSTRTAHVGDVWTEQHVRKVLAILDGDAMYGALYRVALATGMRPGELRALHWTDIDMRRDVINVRRTITKDHAGREVIGTTTKGGKDRAIMVPVSVIDALKAWRTVRGSEGLVFPGASGAILRSNAWERKHTRLCAKAGVPKIRLHDLRHTFATISLENGVHPKIVQEILGHSSIQQTLDTYTHVSTDLQRAAADRLDSMLSHTTTRDDDPPE